MSGEPSKEAVEAARKFINSDGWVWEDNRAKCGELLARLLDSFAAKAKARFWTHCPFDVEQEDEGDPLPEPHCHANRDGECEHFAYCPMEAQKRALEQAASEPQTRSGG